jgi:hypothetical protein
MNHMSGISGPVTWEVVDLRETVSPDGQRTRWDYTVVLEEGAGVGIQFERIEGGAAGPNLETAAQDTHPFTRRLEPHGQLLIPHSETVGWAHGAGPQFGGLAQGGAITVVRRYVGKDDQGKQVVVSTSVHLQPGPGGATRPRPSPEAAALTSGRLDGSYNGVVSFTVGETPRGGGLKATLRQTGHAVTGSYWTVGELGRLAGTVTASEFLGSVAFPRRTCKLEGKLMGGGATFTGTFACSTGEQGTFALNRI